METNDLVKSLVEIICRAKPNLTSKVRRRMKLDENKILLITPLNDMNTEEKLSSWYLYDFYQKPGISIRNEDGEFAPQKPLSWMDTDLLDFNMSNSDEERTERRRRRRRRTRSAQIVPSDETSDTKRYTKLLEERLRKAALLPRGNESVVATQTRHVNNRQHAIPFAQQFLDQLLEDCEYINRQIEVDRREQAEQTDKENARLRRQLEATHAKKVREMKLYNNRSFIKELVDEHLKNSTPQGQLRRIEQLEKNYNELRQEHDALLGRVRRFEEKYGEDKTRHDEDMSKLGNQFNQYHVELKKYKSEVGKTNADLDEKITGLHDQQKQHTVSIQNLFLQRNALDQLSQHIEQIINARHSDLNKLEIFTKNLDSLKDQLDRIQQALSLLDRIPSLSQDIIQIRKLLIQPNVLKDLDLRLSQAQKDIIHHTNELDRLSVGLSNCQSSCQELNQTINDINTKNSKEVLQQLELIKQELEIKSTQIDESNILTRNAFDEIDRLRNSLTDLTKQCVDLQKKFSEMEANNQNTINQLVTKHNKTNISQLLEEQNQLRHQLQDLLDKQQQLSNLASDLKSLKKGIEDLSKPTNEPDQHNSNQFDQEIFKTFLENAKIEIVNLLSPLSQQLNEEIKQVNIFIGDLRAKFEQFLKTQKPSIPLPVKRIPYVESLSPLDLLDDTWN
ncbi:hypothetical protein I4U23_022773 [Adineta vaga]|nr:hypothetical protein I4U23_022773 [Adineta vaga]